MRIVCTCAYRTVNTPAAGESSDVRIVCTCAYHTVNTPAAGESSDVHWYIGDHIVVSAVTEYHSDKVARWLTYPLSEIQWTMK
jgi:hypothetical protein